MIRITDHIAAAGGWLRMDEFMQIALYDATDGYYSTQIEDVGRRGDFSTTATLSAALARALVARWRQACTTAGKKLPIIEIGAGNAALALAIFDEIGFWGSWMTKYHIVESSPKLREFQHLALGSHAKIHATIPTALKACKGQAFIFCNELVDAFPARVFQYSGDQETGSWQELGLSIIDGVVAEESRIPTDIISLTQGDSAPAGTRLSSTCLACAAPEGQRIEVHFSYLNWIRSWLPDWKAGEMLTIDYGGDMEEIYHRRPQGTLRGYKNHQLITPPTIYTMAGKSDLTCDVNFSDLLMLQNSCPEDTFQLLTQKDFLAPFATNSPADQFITHPDGAGQAFKVMIQSR